MVAALGDGQGAQDGSYSPQEALELALRDWVAEINQQALEPGEQWICTRSIPQSLECWISPARSSGGGEGPPALPIWRVSGAVHDVGAHPALLPRGCSCHGSILAGFPWLAAPEPGPALQEEVSQG